MGAVPSTCRVEPTLFTTFDNVTVDYKINDCEHVLLMDGSRHIPIAITTKTVEGQKKMVKILSGITEIQMIPANTLPLPMKVMMGSEELHPVVGEKLIELESKICARQTIVPTPVNKLYERISVLNHPTGMTHVVEKQSGKLYISKQMVKTCLSKPISI